MSQQELTGLRRLGKSTSDMLLFKSFLSHFWWSLFCLSILGAVLYVFAVARVWGRFVEMRTQLVHWELAENFKQYLQPLLDPAVSDQELTRKLAYFSSLTPMFDIYLYDIKRQSLLSTEGRRQVYIPWRPIEDFLRERGDPLGPLVLDAAPFEQLDERNERTFSAARISIDDRPGYLIVLLRGRRYVAAVRRAGEASLPELGFFLFGSVILICSLTGHLLFYLLTRRFGRMTKVVRAFQQGDLTQRIDDTSADEVGVYARAFDQMADTIVSNVEDLQRIDDQRRKLVANVSHELRRPLSMLSLSLETLAEEDQRCTSVERRSYINQALEGCDNLAKLIADLFELSKLNAAESAADIEACELHELAHDVVVKFEQQAAEAGVKLSIDYPQNLPPALADIALLDRALSNLVENGIRYSRPGGVVNVGISLPNGSFRLEVKDEGIGIAPQDLPRIFDRFYRGENAREQETEGAGLGLAIAKRIIEVHGQQLSVESSPEQGTSFSFHLPVAQE